MNLADLKEKLGEDFAPLEAYINDLIGQRDAARKESAEGRRSLKARAETAEALATQLMDKLGIETAEELETLPDAKGQAEAMKQFEIKVRRLENELKTRTEALTTLDARHRTMRLDAELQQALSGHEWLDREIVADYLKQRVEWQDDQIYVKDQDQLKPLAESAAQLAQTRPHLLKTPGARGSGYNPHQQGGTAKAAALTRAAFEALDPVSRAAHLKAGGTLTD